MKKIKTKTAEFSLDKRGFLKIIFLDNDEDIDVTEVHNHIKAAAEITNNKKLPVLADIRKGTHNAETKAKEMIAAYEMKIAEAVIIDSLAQRIVGNFYLKLSLKRNKKFPIRLFTKEKDAIKWLLQFV